MKEMGDDKRDRDVSGIEGPRLSVKAVFSTALLTREWTLSRALEWL